MLFFVMLPINASDQKCLLNVCITPSISSQCVRWYLAYALSLRNLEEMMAERGVIVDHLPTPTKSGGLSPSEQFYSCWLPK
jgi:putative transposase